MPSEVRLLTLPPIFQEWRVRSCDRPDHGSKGSVRHVPTLLRSRFRHDADQAALATSPERPKGFQTRYVPALGRRAAAGRKTEEDRLTEFCSASALFHERPGSDTADRPRAA